MPLDLRKLYHAAVLAHERNFTKAANKLCITQPALSRSVTKLEAELGFHIFDRNPGDVSLTAIGKNFMGRAQLLLDHAQEVSHDMTLMRDGLSGSLAFGMTPYSAAVFLSDLTSHVLHNQEGFKVRIDISSREQLLDKLNAEDIECFIASSNWFSPGAQYSIEPLFDLKLSFYIRKNHPLASQKISNSLVLLDYPFIGAVVAPKHLLNLKFALGLPPNSSFQLTVECDDFPLLKSMALTSDAILIAPYLVLIDEYQNGEFKELKLTGSLAELSKATIDVCLIKFSNKLLSPGAQSMIDVLVETNNAVTNSTNS